VYCNITQYRLVATDVSEERKSSTFKVKVLTTWWINLILNRHTDNMYPQISELLIAKRILKSYAVVSVGLRFFLHWHCAWCHCCAKSTVAVYIRSWWTAFTSQDINSVQSQFSFRSYQFQWIVFVVIMLQLLCGTEPVYGWALGKAGTCQRKY
jgi:hypothetical protein